MNILKLDPNVLEQTADIIELYCLKQMEIMDSYLKNISYLTNEWEDDETLGKIIEEIRILKSQVGTVMDEINEVYPKYFKEKAEFIRRRPKR